MRLCGIGGSTIQLRGWGDQNHAVFETLDGYTVTKNPATGFQEVARVSALFYLVPPLSAMIAWPLLGERLAPLAWVGMAIAALGVALVSRKAKLPAA